MFKNVQCVKREKVTNAHRF